MIRSTRRGAAAAALFVFLSAGSPAALAQATAGANDRRITMVIRDAPLAEALSHLVEVSQISLVYGPELDRNATVYCSAREQPPEEVLRCIVESAGKDFYRLSSGTYVVIERAEAPPRRGSFSGMIVCAETGEPLPYANVLLADAGSGTAANEFGMFVLSGLLPGEHRIIASYVGYEPAAAEIDVPFDGDVRRQIALRPEPVIVVPVIVDGLQQRPPSSALGFDEITERAPGSGPAGGALTGTRSALGIASRPLTSSLHIQGGEAGEHQFQIDGVPVFEPLSFGQLFGSFSPLAVDRVAVQKAGFGATHGSFTAGLVQLDHGLNAPEDAVVTADPYAASGRVNQGFAIGGREGRIMAAGRVGLWDAWRVPMLDELLRDWNEIDPLLMAQAIDPGSTTLDFTPHRRGTELGFADVHAAARFNVSPFSTVRASGFHGASRVGTELFAASGDAGGAPDRATLTRDGYRWSNTAGQLRYSSLLGARALASIGVRASHHSSSQAYAMIARPGLAQDTDFGVVEREMGEELDVLTAGDRGNLNRMKDVAAEARLDLSLASRQLLEVGIEAAHTDHRLALDGPFYRVLQSESAAWRLAAFAQDRRQLGDHLTLESGVRLTYVPNRQTAYAEPRLAVRVDGTHDVVGTYALRLASGVYRQFVNQFDVTAVGPSALVPSVRFWLPVDNSLAPPLAMHVAAEALISPASGWDFRAETYYKHLPRLLAIDYTSLLDHGDDAGTQVDQEAFIGASRGFAFGAGVRLDRTGQIVRLRVGYDYSVSRRTFPSRFDGRMQPAPWNEPHRAVLAAEVAVTSRLALRTQARGVWGRAWAYRQAYYDVLVAHDHPIESVIGLPGEGALPALYEVDLGITYSHQVGGMRIEATADVLNILDRPNVLDYGLRPAGGGYEIHARHMLGIHPILTIRIAR